MSKMGRIFRSRWVRLPLLLWASFLLVAVAVYFTSRYRTRQEGRKEVDSIVARLDAEESGWRWRDIESRRPREAGSPDGVVVRFQRAMANENTTLSLMAKKSFDRYEPINRRLPEETLDEIEGFLEESQAVVVAREFEAGPGDARWLRPKPDLLYADTEDTAAVARAVTVLSFDVEAECARTRYEAAVARLRAMLNAGRSIGEGPALASQSNRMNAATQVASRAERVLALGEPKAGLKELQAEVLTESKVNYALVGARGERAAVQEWFEGIEAGEVDLRKIVARGWIFSQWRGRGDRQTTLLVDQSWWLYQKYVPHSHAEALEYMTRICRACARPQAEHMTVLAELQRERFTPTRENYLARILLFPLDLWLTRQMRTHTRLRCAAAGIAVERFRQKFGRWPESLEQIPSDLLPGVPTDPFDGKPLKYRLRDDGAEVFSVQAQATESTGTGSFETSQEKQDSYLRFRLYDPNRRNLPPPPAPFSDFPDFDFDLEFPRRWEWEDDNVGPEVGPPPREVPPGR